VRPLRGGWFGVSFCLRGESMREHLEFLKTSSLVVKISAWVFLIFGIIGGAGIFMGLVPNEPRLKGFLILAAFFFVFSLLYLVAKMADLLIQMIHEIHALKKE
jgi:hypothetical protein